MAGHRAGVLTIDESGNNSSPKQLKENEYVAKLLDRTQRLAASSQADDNDLSLDLATALVDFPESAHLHHALGIAIARLGQSERSISASALQQATGHFRRALGCDGNHVLARLNVAEALVLADSGQEAQQEAKTALATLERADALDPLVWENAPFPAASELFQKEWIKAGKDAQKKHNLLAWRLHTLLAELTGDLLHYYEAALTRPDLPTTHAALGCALARGGYLEQALPHLRSAARLDPSDRAAARALYDLLGQRNRHDEQRRFARDQRALNVKEPEKVPAEDWFAIRQPPANALASIIILCCNQAEFTRQCLESVLQRTRQPYELILIDNGSTDDTPAYLQQIRQRPEAQKTVIIRNEENLGFAKGCNQGLAAADGEFLVLLNNDTIVAEGWLDGLIRWAVHEWPKNGLIGPVTNCASPPQQIDVGYRTLRDLDSFATEYRRQFAGKAFETERLVGFCLLLRRDVLETIGTLDEQFGLGFFEDDDWGVRAREAGYRLLVAQEVFIHHFGNRTFAGLGIDAYQQLQDNFALFEKKWGKDHTKGYRLPDKAADPQSTEAIVEDNHDEPIVVETTEDSPRPKVSLCMIVCNEEKNLTECLSSVTELVDEMIILDTGSTDRTKDIAQEFGAKVFDFKWVDSFAAARNASIQPATGEWIMWIDADERLDEENREKLRQLLDNLPAENIAYFQRQRSPLESAAHAAVYVDQVRLFRNLPGLNWQYRVHEQILPSLRALGAEVAHSNVVVDHAGYADAPVQAAKVERNLKLLQLELEERPGDSFVLYNLGAVCLSDNRTDEALTYLQRSLEHSEPSDTLRPKLFSLLTKLHHERGQNDRAMVFCRQGSQEHPRDPELMFWEAVLRQHAGDLAGCERALLQLLQAPNAAHLTSADAGLQGYRTRHFLADILCNQQRYPEAEAQWRKAVEECPRFAPAWQQLAWLWLEQHRFDEMPDALSQLRQDPAMLLEADMLEARAQLAQRQFTAAKQLLQKTIAEHPEQLPPRILLTHVLLQEAKDWEAAEQALRDVLRIDPEHAEAKRNLQMLLRQQGESSQPRTEAASTKERICNTATGSQRVSLCMIVKNEEDNLADCLQSADALFAEMIVVDTGSTDRTKAIAKEFGAKVFDFKWIDSFAAARNDSLLHATGDWVFWLDADDRLDEANREQLRRLFAKLDGETAAYVMKCLCLADPESKRETVVDHVRLFRNHPDLRWRYRVHEQILPALRRLGAHVRWSDVVIHHTGYQDTDLRARKLERDLRLLNLEVEEQPDDPFTLFNLASIYREQGKLAEAIPLFERSLAGSSPGDSIVRKLYVLLAQSHRQLGDTVKALEVCDKGLGLFATDVELLFQQAIALKETGDLQGAENSWLAVLSTDPGQHFASVDVGLRGHMTHQNLATLYQQQGKHDKALEHFRAVLAEKPDYPAALQGIIECHLQQQNWDEFDSAVTKLQSLGDKEVEATVMQARRHMALAEFEAACSLLRVCIADHPDALWPRVILSHALLQQGKDWEAAEQALKDVLALDPDHTEAKNNLAVLRNRQEKATSNQRDVVPAAATTNQVAASSSLKQLLVSMCNVHVPGLENPSEEMLWKYDLEQGEFEAVQLNHPQLPQAQGVTGLVHYRDGIVAALQSEPVVLVFLDSSFRLKEVWGLKLARDVHSLAVHQDKIYLTSTGNDAVIEFTPATSERIIWQASNSSRDTIHVNSLCRHEGTWHVTAFGKKEEGMWKEAKVGSLFTVPDGREVRSTLYHPHSAVARPEGIYLCESFARAVSGPDGQSLKVDFGYTRGLLLRDNLLCVGVSQRRKQSRSQKIVLPTSEPGWDQSQAGIAIYLPDWKNLANSELQTFVPLAHRGKEVYDLLALA